MKDKLLNQMVGAMDERDEYQKQEIHKEMAFSGIILWYLSMALMLFMVVWDTMQQAFTLYPVLLFVINMVYAGYMMVAVKKKQLDESDCATWDEYEEKKKKLKSSAIKGGIVWVLFMLIAMEYMLPVIGGNEVSLSIGSFVVWGVAGAVFSILYYGFSKSRLNKPIEEEI